jgi:hypothetical protein
MGMVHIADKNAPATTVLKGGENKHLCACYPLIHICSGIAMPLQKQAKAYCISLNRIFVDNSFELYAK